MATATLTDEERRIIKALLAKGEKNQDILALINTNRKAPVNSGRISGIKKDPNQETATDEEIKLFQLRKVSYNPKTGLNDFDDERLVRARESMILAVQIFNSPSLKFKTEIFTVLANIAWTYLLHEYYIRANVPIVDDRKRSLLLSQILDRQDCPLSDGIKMNLRSIKTLRDRVEHLLLGPADTQWFSLFQACCLNFDKVICEHFGSSMSLSNDLNFALQFAKPSIAHLSSLMNYQIPPDIAAIDAYLTQGMTDDEINDIEYKFQVVYTLDSASKSRSNFAFISSDSEQGAEIHNVLARKIPADDLYPHKVKNVILKVKENTAQNFTSRNHTQAWKLFRVRPATGAKDPAQTDRRYCIYHKAHRDYTYSNEWIERLTTEVSDPVKFNQIKTAPA